jgi:DNA mismatch endonuclease (patch repair protein)
MGSLSPEERTIRMRLIRKVDTKPELIVRRLAHALGLRFRLHRRDLPGTPDLAFPRHRKVVLVHGCFWHQHEGCRLARQPRSKPDYWLPKLARNVERDRLVEARLAELGWEPLVIWECETRNADLIRERLARFLGPR